MSKDEARYVDKRIEVPEDFVEVFSHFYFACNNSVETITKTLFPSFQTILIFNFGSETILDSKEHKQINIGKCIVLGPIKRAFDYTLTPGSEILVANFRDDAFYRFFGNASVAENLPLDPDDMLEENCFTALWIELNKIDDINRRVEYILGFCRPYLKQRNVIAEQLAKFRDESASPIKSVASLQQQSERNIQLHHKKHLGYSAKEINRYQRFLKAIELLQNMTSQSSMIDWFEIISECGYYDQSQLIHDFRHYIGLTPKKYLGFLQDICKAKP